MSPSSAGLDGALPDNIISELALWERLVFRPDIMAHPNDDDDDDEDATHQEEDPPPTWPQNSQVPQNTFLQAPQLPQETYTYLIHALLSLQNSAQAHHPSLANNGYPWPPSVPGPYSPIPLPPHAPPQSSSSASSSSQLPAAPSATTSTAQDPEGTEDATSITEDKRRRNTAASARFRLKKKLKTLNLERSVADLTGRTEELEREASDLRRENAWLKEIVLLKGRHLATSSTESQSQAPGPSSRRDEDEDKGESEPESTTKQGKKGKGKGKES